MNQATLCWRVLIEALEVNLGEGELWLKYIWSQLGYHNNDSSYTCHPRPRFCIWLNVRARGFRCPISEMVKPWPTESQVNASWKLGCTCDSVWPRLPCTCSDLRWLTHFGRNQICTQVKASFSPFGHQTKVDASWMTSINLLLPNEIEDILP